MAGGEFQDAFQPQAVVQMTGVIVVVVGVLAPRVAEAIGAVAILGDQPQARLQRGDPGAGRILMQLPIVVVVALAKQQRRIELQTLDVHRLRVERPGRRGEQRGRQ